MYLNFETELDNTIGLPLLAEVHQITPDTVIHGVKIDGLIIDLDAQITERLRSSVARINTETLEPKHFRDCNHFAMAMCGLWMPTHAPYTKDFSMKIECRDNTVSTEEHGPIALGIPNDSRCVGFGDQPFVYSHSMFGISTSVGSLCLSKLGIDAKYSISTFDAALREHELEVAHPINSLTILENGVDVFQWSHRG